MWEYKQSWIIYSDFDKEAKLQDNAGWELVSVFERMIGIHNSFICFWKKKKENQGE